MAWITLRSCVVKPDQIFQFTLGPVQGFVAQARRTRDFWAGSFILSWLSSVAMASIQQQGGTVSFPQPDAHYLDWLLDRADSHPPLQGSVPNRFKAMTAHVGADFNPAQVQQSVAEAWASLANVVWDQDLESLVNDATRRIWKRQTAQFWEISWVISDKEGGNFLDRRKQWRNLVSAPEPGHKCMMMDGWQELSGVESSSMAEVRAFWSSLRDSGKSGMQTDLRDGEQLCAMAFIKRRFARHFHLVDCHLAGSEQRIVGWHLPSAVPSVSFLAAAPWIAAAIRQAPPTAFEIFNQAASALSEYSELAHVGGDEHEIDICCVSDAVRQREGFLRRWAGLDGQVYFPTALQNINIFADQKKADLVLKALQDLRKAAGLKDLPSPFYAIVLMDGDQLGVQMGDLAKQQPISRALNAFTEKAGERVRQHNGFLVYAGGDDVLAIFPLEDALPAATDLRHCYQQCFVEHGAGKVTSTLSGAIEFVHIRTPLTRVLQDAHQLLDRVAKDETGRDALAIRVWKPSGMAVEWSMPWEKLLDPTGVPVINQLVEQFASETNDTAHFSSKFFYRAKQIIERFPDMASDVMVKVLETEYLHSFGSRARRLDPPALDALHASLLRLLALSQRWQRRLDSNGSATFEAAGLNPDAALLVRFLAEKGMSRDSA